MKQPRTYRPPTTWKKVEVTIHTESTEERKRRLKQEINTLTEQINYLNTIHPIQITDFNQYITTLNAKRVKLTQKEYELKNTKQNHEYK